MADLGFRAKEVNEQEAPSSGGNKPVLKTANRNLQWYFVEPLWPLRLSKQSHHVYILVQKQYKGWKQYDMDKNHTKELSKK